MRVRVEYTFYSHCMNDFSQSVEKEGRGGGGDENQGCVTTFKLFSIFSTFNLIKNSQIYCVLGDYLQLVKLEIYFFAMSDDEKCIC